MFEFLQKQVDNFSRTRNVARSLVHRHGSSRLFLGGGGVQLGAKHQGDSHTAPKAKALRQGFGGAAPSAAGGV